MINFIKSGAIARRWSSGSRPGGSLRRDDECSWYTDFCGLIENSATTCWILHMLQAWGPIPILMKWIRGPLLLSDLELGASLWRCLLRSLWGAYRHQLSVVRLHHGGLQVQVPLANCFVLLSVAALMLCFLLAVWYLLSRISAVMDCRWRLAAAKIAVEWRCRVRWMMCIAAFADVWRRFSLRRPRRTCPPREPRHRPQLQRQSARMQARAQELSCFVQAPGAEDGGEILERDRSRSRRRRRRAAALLLPRGPPPPPPVLCESAGPDLLGDAEEEGAGRREDSGRDGPLF